MKRMFGSLLRQGALVMAVVMGIWGMVPRVEAAFIPSPAAVQASQRAGDLASVRQVLEHKMVKERLSTLGYTQEEIDARLALLSDQELHQFATHLDALNAGGDGGVGFIIGVLLIVLLVIVILKLVDKQIIIR